jgi:hypothetical protein
MMNPPSAADLRPQHKGAGGERPEHRSGAPSGRTNVAHERSCRKLSVTKRSFTSPPPWYVAALGKRCKARASAPPTINQVTPRPLRPDFFDSIGQTETSARRAGWVCFTPKTGNSMPSQGLPGWATSRLAVINRKIACSAVSPKSVQLIRATRQREQMSATSM